MDTDLAMKADLPSKGLRELREDRGFRWSWLAAKAQVSYPALLNWVKGARIPYDARLRIAEALGLTPDQIADEPAPAADDSADGADDRRTFDRRATDRHAAPEGS